MLFVCNYKFGLMVEQNSNGAQCALSVSSLLIFFFVKVIKIYICESQECFSFYILVDIYLSNSMAMDLEFFYVNGYLIEVSL